MNYFKICLKSGHSYIVKSEKTNIELLRLITENEWYDYTLAEQGVVYTGNKRTLYNTITIKSSEIVSIEYYI